MIKHLIMDVDGVLNTGQFFYSSEGKLLKAFGAHDKDGLKIAAKLGLTINFITADATGFKITHRRIVEDWGFGEDQLSLVTEEDRMQWIKNRFNLDEVAYVADGYYDAPILSRVGVGIAPCSGRTEAKQAAKYVTESRAGEGAVLDACLFLKQLLTQ